MTAPAVVLCISGHDPCGGAGIQADIEAVAAAGAHAVTVITAHTVQDTSDVRRVAAVDATLLDEQLRVLAADVPIAAVKIGLLGSAAQVPVLLQFLARLGRPVVLDPVLRAGGGAMLASPGLAAGLLAATTVATPNADEARGLAPAAADLDTAGAALVAAGARHVLITGGDEPGDAVVNRWYRAGHGPRRYVWPRLAGGFHGAGCTLAAAIAARLAQGMEVAAALEDAQAFTQRALAAAVAIGGGRRIPRRIHQ
ncbi:MAG TPA: hydroxymethylpyrimidine/phosphomethylpyrimidine kinase [Candidatus Binatia bacterium]|nr:hydroxymethylpyrimidine/phosphomethylpyrimidine kinase [Candidatus Binatia bacterium]